jgi:hypothetical protein
MLLKEFFSVPSIEKHQDGSKSKDSDRAQLANDVYWFILDHDRLHKQHFVPIAQEIYNAVKQKKSIDQSKYTECWMPMVEQGCSEFYDKNKMKGRPKDIFDEELRKEICQKIAERHIEDIKKGEYNLGA